MALVRTLEVVVCQKEEDVTSEGEWFAGLAYIFFVFVLPRIIALLFLGACEYPPRPLLIHIILDDAAPAEAA